MKHKKKCIEKKQYSTIQKVTKAIARNYLNGHEAIYYYECDICLDFHLTKNPKANHVDYSHIQKQTMKLIFPDRKSVKKLIQTRMIKMRKHLKMCSERNKNKIKRGVVLPIELQREALLKLKQANCE